MKKFFHLKEKFNLNRKILNINSLNFFVRHCPHLFRPFMDS